MGRVRVEDLPSGNAVSAQIEIHQGALARDPDAALGRLSKILGGPEHRALRLAFVEWIRQSLAPGLDPTWEKVSKLKARLMEIAELGEFEDMKSFMLKSMEEHWLGQGMERGVTVGMEQARADERARSCEQARRKFSRRAAERLAAAIDGVSSADRLAEVGNWIIDCGTEAEFLARTQPGG